MFIYLIVIYSSKKMENNPAVQQWGYDQLIYGHIYLYVTFFSQSDICE